MRWCWGAAFKLCVLVIVVMLRRGFQPSCLGDALVVMIRLASEVWTLLSDDLSSVIFGQSRVGTCYMVFNILYCWAQIISLISWFLLVALFSFFTCKILSWFQGILLYRHRFCKLGVRADAVIPWTVNFCFRMKLGFNICLWWFLVKDLVNCC